MPGCLLSTMLALSLAMLGIYAAIGTWSLPTSILTGTARQRGLALINSIGNCGGFAGPVMVGQLNGATGDFTGALLFLAGGACLGRRAAQCISARSRGNGGEAGARYSEFPL